MELKGVQILIQIFDMEKSLAYYRDILGFKEVAASKPENNYDWVMLKKGEASLMLNTAFEEGERPSAPDPARESAHSDTVIYFHCDSVDEYYQHLLANGCEVHGPENTFYGMKQIYTKDPDGYELCFQHPIENEN